MNTIERFSQALTDKKDNRYSLTFFEAKYDGVCALTGIKINAYRDRIGNSQLGYVSTNGLMVAGLAGCCRDDAQGGKHEHEGHLARIAEYSQPYSREVLDAWLEEGGVDVTNKDNKTVTLFKVDTARGVRFAVGSTSDLRPMTEKQLARKLNSAVWVQKAR